MGAPQRGHRRSPARVRTVSAARAGAGRGGGEPVARSDGVRGAGDAVLHVKLASGGAGDASSRVKIASGRAGNASPHVKIASGRAGKRSFTLRSAFGVLAGEPRLQRMEPGYIDGDAVPFHLGEDVDQWELDVLQEGGRIHLGELRLEQQAQA